MSDKKSRVSNKVFEKALGLVLIIILMILCFFVNANVICNDTKHTSDNLDTREIFGNCRNFGVR